MIMMNMWLLFTVDMVDVMQKRPIQDIKIKSCFFLFDSHSVF